MAYYTIHCPALTENLLHRCRMEYGHVGSHRMAAGLSYENGWPQDTFWPNPEGGTEWCDYVEWESSVTIRHRRDDDAGTIYREGQAVSCAGSKGHSGEHYNYQRGERVFLSLFDWSIY